MNLAPRSIACSRASAPEHVGRNLHRAKCADAGRFPTGGVCAVGRCRVKARATLGRHGKTTGGAGHAHQDRVRHRALGGDPHGAHLPAASPSVAPRRPPRARDPSPERWPAGRGVHRQLRQSLRPGQRAARRRHHPHHQRRGHPRFRLARRAEPGRTPARSDGAALLHAAVPAAEPLLRGRQRAAPLRLEHLRPHAARLGAGAGDRRLRAPAPALQLQDGAADADGARRLPRARRRLPGLHAPGDHPVPLHEHPGPLHDRLPGRHRRPAGARPDGFQRLVRSLPRRPLVHLRCAAQQAPHRPHRHGARP